MTKKESRCVFCGALSYGRNCTYSHFVQKIHLHTDDPTKCSYCGSKTVIGPGCQFSPTGKHMASANFYNGLAAESFIIGYIMKTLATPIHETQAFKLGIVDASGAIIKHPETLEEQMAYTPIDAYIFKLKNLLGNKKDLLNNEIYLEAVSKNAELPISLYDKEVKLKNDMRIVAKRFKEVLDESAEQGLPIMLVQKIILEALREI
jgi:hypothetical protein